MGKYMKMQQKQYFKKCNTRAALCQSQTQKYTADRCTAGCYVIKL